LGLKPGLVKLDFNYSFLGFPIKKNFFYQQGFNFFHPISGGAYQGEYELVDVEGPISKIFKNGISMMGIRGSRNRQNNFFPEMVISHFQEE